jgi:hypothetical protein
VDGLELGDGVGGEDSFEFGGHWGLKEELDWYKSENVGERLGTTKRLVLV